MTRHIFARDEAMNGNPGAFLPLSTGTLYAAIKRLGADGLIEGAEGRADPELDDARRRYYQLTVLGKRVVRMETERLAELVKMSRDKQLSPFFSGGGVG